MAQWNFPMLSVGGDRRYSDKDFALFYQHLFKNGVVASVGQGLKVTASPSGGMRVMVGMGAAMLNGYQYCNTETLSLTVPVASAQERIDSIVVRHNIGAREIVLAYKQNDIRVVRNDSMFELQLCTLRIPSNASSVLSSYITDKRADDTVCGYSSPFEEISVSGLEEQYRARLEELLGALNQQVTSTLSSIRNQLSANQAANLQRQIEDLQQGVQNFGQSISAVFSALNGFLPRDGGTMSGSLDMGGNSLSNLPTPKLSHEATNKNYVDSKYNQAFPKSGGWLNGDLNMAENYVVHQAKAPIADAHVANKGYVDGRVRSGTADPSGTAPEGTIYIKY